MPWPRMRWRHHFSNSIRSSVCFADEHGTSILKDEVSFGISCFLYPMLSQVIRFYQIESHNSHNICLSWIFGLSLSHLLPIDFEQKKRPFQHSWGATSSALHCLQKFHPRLHGDSPPWWSPSCPRRSDGRPPENQRVPVPFYVLIFILEKWTSAVCFFLIQVFKVYFFQLPHFLPLFVTLTNSTSKPSANDRAAKSEMLPYGAQVSPKSEAKIHQKADAKQPWQPKTRDSSLHPCRCQGLLTWK